MYAYYSQFPVLLRIFMFPKPTHSNMIFVQVIDFKTGVYYKPGIEIIVTEPPVNRWSEGY